MRVESRGVTACHRQLYDSTGEVIADTRYDPYGNVMSQSGAATSAYGFAGEMTDPTGLVFLRARYYDSAQGRFLTRDEWEEDYNAPLTLNAWNYTNGNPVNYTDPSGYLTQNDEANADTIRAHLQTSYNVVIPKDYGLVQAGMGGCFLWMSGAWRTLQELQWTEAAVTDMATTMGGPQKFQNAMRGTVTMIRRGWTDYDFPKLGPIRPFAPPAGQILGDVDMPDYMFDNESYAKYNIPHELAHVWDRRTGLQLSHNMSQFIGTERCSPGGMGGGIYCWFDITAGREAPPGFVPAHNQGDWKQEYAATDALEDWAEAVASVVHPDYYSAAKGYQPIGALRRQYVLDQIQAIP